MSSSDAMFETSLYFKYVNERAGHVKIDRDSVSNLMVVNLEFLLLSDGFRLLGFNE